MKPSNDEVEMVDLEGLATKAELATGPQVCAKSEEVKLISPAERLLLAQSIFESSFEKIHRLEVIAGYAAGRGFSFLTLSKMTFRNRKYMKKTADEEHFPE